MVALKAMGWGAALAVAGLGLGFLYTTAFADDTYGGLDGLVPMIVGLVVGAVTGVIACLTADRGARKAPADEGRALALAMIGPPVALAVFAVVLHALRFGVDIVPASLFVGVVGGLGTGSAWAWSKRRGIRAHPVVAGMTWLVLAAATWLLATAFGLRAGNENSLQPEFFFYLTLILPLQVAAPVSQGYRAPDSGQAESGAT